MSDYTYPKKLEGKVQDLVVAYADIHGITWRDGGYNTEVCSDDDAISAINNAMSDVMQFAFTAAQKNAGARVEFDYYDNQWEEFKPWLMASEHSMLIKEYIDQDVFEHCLSAALNYVKSAKAEQPAPQPAQYPAAHPMSMLSSFARSQVTVSNALAPQHTPLSGTELHATKSPSSYETATYGPAPSSPHEAA